MRADDLGANSAQALMQRNPGVDWTTVTDILGCANQAGEDNRNVARMAGLACRPAAGPVPGATINRLCGSGLTPSAPAARAIKAGEAGLMIAGGVESMSRALRHAQGRERLQPRNAVYDTTIGWRFVNKLMKAQVRRDSMPETPRTWR